MNVSHDGCMEFLCSETVDSDYLLLEEDNSWGGLLLRNLTPFLCTISLYYIDRPNISTRVADLLFPQLLILEWTRCLSLLFLLIPISEMGKL